jgi:type IV pilus assembly protein PilC
MAIYEYRAKDTFGTTLVGAVEAPSENVAVDVLREKELVVLSLSERKRGGLLQASLSIFNRVTSRDVTIFARQLAVMISATVPIVQALRILVKQTENVTFKIIISQIADEVDGGAKLSTTLARYPKVFSDFFVYMVRSGETTGKLDETLVYLADQQERDYDLQSKIRGALIYPAFIFSALVVVGGAMMIFVVPQLTGILTSSGTELPFATKLLISVSSFLRNQWWVLVIVAAVASAAFRAYQRTPGGATSIDRFKMQMPIFGQIYQRIYLIRFSRSLATLLVSGIPLPRSLEIVADIVGNRVYRILTLETITSIEAGNSIASVFIKHKEVPPMLSQMMTVGEQTGKLDTILGKLANFYSRELENMVANLVSLIEPLILVLMGVAVATLVVAILLPIYNLSSAIN